MDILWYFLGAVVIIALTIVFNIARREAKREAKRADRLNFVVRAPSLYTWIGLAVMGLTAAGILVLAIQFGDIPGVWFPCAFFAFLLLVGVYMVCYTFRWRLHVSGNMLTLSPTFGREKSWPVASVTHIETGTAGGIRVYADKAKLFSVDTVSIGSNMLVAYFIEKGVKMPEWIHLGWGKGQLK
jgi:hypothetical protein